MATTGIPGTMGMAREIIQGNMLPDSNVLLHRRTDTVASVAVAVNVMVMGDGALPNLSLRLLLLLTEITIITTCHTHTHTRKTNVTIAIIKTATTMDLPTHPHPHHRNLPARQRSVGPFSRVLWLGLNRTVRSCHCPPSLHCREGGLGRVWSTYPKFNPAKRVEWTTWPLSCG